MASTPLRLFAPLLFVGNLGVIITLWSQGSLQGAFAAGTVGMWLIALGALAGLLAFYLILWQLLLIGRVGWIQRVWGHDRLSHLHHLSGLVAISILLLHPIFLVLGYSKEAETTPLGQLNIFLTSYPSVWYAFIAYVLFVAIIIMTLTIIRKRLRYETWYFIHVWMYVAIFLSFTHQWRNGHDLGSPGSTLYWKIIFWSVLGSVVYYRLLRPLWAFWYYRFRVDHLEKETPNVTSVIIKGRNFDRLGARAGQFVIVRFLMAGFWWQAHPFSLSELPDGKRLRLTIKAVGDFTENISLLQSGTPVIVEGPLGRFVAERSQDKPVLLIAGGIGITPLRGLFEEYVLRGRPVDLIYAARSEGDLALRDEIDHIAQKGGRVHYVPGDTKGNLSPELIKAAVPDVVRRYVYLCGPPPMMKVVREQLATLGVPKSNILYEKFQLG